jgi:hypothetical protein
MTTPATSVRRAGAGMRLLRAAVFAAVCVALAAAGHEIASGRPVPVWSLVFGWLAVLAIAAPPAGRERSLPGIAALLGAGQLALHAVFSTGQMCGALAASSGTAASDHGVVAVAARLVCGGSGHGVALTPAAARRIVTEAGLGSAVPSGSMPPMASMPSMPSLSSVAWTPGIPGAGSHAAGSLTGAADGGSAAGVPHAAAMLLSMCSLPMVLGHLLAAVAAGWLLRRGEAALWRLVRLSARGAAQAAALAGPAVLRLAYALLSALSAPCARALGPRPHALAAAPGAARHRTVWRLRHSLARRGPPAFALAA